MDKIQQAKENVDAIMATEDAGRDVNDWLALATWNAFGGPQL